MTLKKVFSKKTYRNFKLDVLVITDPIGGVAKHFPSLRPMKNDTKRHLPDFI